MIGEEFGGCVNCGEYWLRQATGLEKVEGRRKLRGRGWCGQWEVRWQFYVDVGCEKATGRQVL